jgi:ABC-2 type transport system ATP-binding protein
MIRAIGLTKRFGTRTAVAGISFEITQGQIVGFLGPNGAGKTTTMRMLTAFLPPDEGRAELLGLDVRREPLAVRRRLGYLPENNPLYDEFEVTDTLNYSARLRGITNESDRRTRVKAVLKTCGLKSVIGKRAGELSKGFRQRLGLAQAILHDPDVLILDEPTAGLDPNQVQEVRGLIRELRKEKTVLLSTHILPEVTATCDRALIISEGRIVADGPPDHLTGEAQARNLLYVELKAPPKEALAALADLPATSATSKGDGFLIDSPCDRDLREEVFRLAVDRRWPILAMRLEKPTLEEIFRNLTRSA